MALLNSKAGYGSLTKLFHWLIAALFLLQFISGPIMQHLAKGQTFVGMSGGTLYNWHKSLGLVALFIAFLRLVNRKKGSLPPWAKSLSKVERAYIHRYEQIVYPAMFIMPIAGFVFVMAGGYGVLLFGLWPLPNPIGKIPALALVAEWIHYATAWILALAILSHVAIVLKHQLLLRDGLLLRMLPRPKTP